MGGKLIGFQVAQQSLCALYLCVLHLSIHAGLMLSARRRALQSN